MLPRRDEIWGAKLFTGGWMVDCEFDNVIVFYLRQIRYFADIEAVGVAEPVKHAASGIFGEAVVRGSGEAVAGRKFVVYHAAHGFPECRFHRICFQNLFRCAHDSSAIGDVEQAVLDRSEKLLFTGKLAAGTDNKIDALVDKPGNNSHIFRVDQKCAVFDERSIDIGCDQLYHNRKSPYLVTEKIQTIARPENNAKKAVLQGANYKERI